MQNIFNHVPRSSYLPITPLPCARELASEIRTYYIAWTSRTKIIVYESCSSNCQVTCVKGYGFSRDVTKLMFVCDGARYKVKNSMSNAIPICMRKSKFSRELCVLKKYGFWTDWSIHRCSVSQPVYGGGGIDVENKVGFRYKYNDNEIVRNTFLVEM